MSHDPSLAERRRQARINGGKGRARAARAQRLLPDDLEMLDKVLSTAIGAVYQGGISPAQGSSIAALVGGKVRLREIALKILEGLDLESRITALEEKFSESEIKSVKNGRSGYTRRG
jgi:hypothetical protein